MSTAARDQGFQALQAGDLETALARLNEAYQEDPGDYQTLLYLGSALGMAGQHAQAVEVLQRAAQVNAGAGAAHYNLGVALERAGRVSDAEAAYNQALAVEPSYTRAREALARLGAGPCPEGARGYPAGSGAGPARGPGPSESPFASAAPGAAPSGPEAAGAVPPGAASPGLHYVPTPEQAEQPPPAGLRIVRGIGWGALYGQIWTVLTVLWYGLIYGWLRQMPAGSSVALVILCIVAFGFAGAVVGALTGATNASPGAGAMIGAGAGLLFFLLQLLMSRSAFVLVNVFFWFFTGQMVGARTWSRVHQPVPR